MIKYRECSIVFTNFCNIKCDHCYVSTTNRKNAKVMPLSKLEKYVSLLHEAGVEKINLTGGEPFLYLDKLVKAIGIISALGCNPTVITNAFWAYNQNIAKSIISKLSKVGLTEIHLSTDRFHAQFIPVENVIHACNAATQIGIPCFVFITKIKEDPFYSYLKVRLSEISAQIVEQYIKFDKRKLNIFQNKFKINLNNMHPHDGPCLSVLNPLIDIDGQMFICCSPIGHFDTKSLFFIADLNKENEARLKLRNEHLLSHFLYEYGPVALYRKIRTFDKMLPQMVHYYSTCDLCNEILGSDKYKEAVKRVLSDFSPKHDLIYELQSFV